MNEIVREMAQLLRGEATRYGISMRTDLADDLPKVMADRVQLQQVLMNLMLNAIDVMEGPRRFFQGRDQRDCADARRLWHPIAFSGGRPRNRGPQSVN